MLRSRTAQVLEQPVAVGGSITGMEDKLQPSLDMVKSESSDTDENDAQGRGSAQTLAQQQDGCIGGSHADEVCSTRERQRLSLTSQIEMKAEEWVQSEQAELVFGAIIALNAVVIGLEVEAELRYGEQSLHVTMLYRLQCVFSILFAGELLLRTRAVGFQRMFCRNLNGIFDTAVVIITLADLWAVNLLVRSEVVGSNGQKSLDALCILRILQLLRLVRIVRLLRVSRQLSLLVVGLAESFGSVLWVFLMLFVVIYCGAIFCASELGTSDDPNLRLAFGTIWRSMYSHFKIMTLEAWPDICGWAMDQNNLWVAYFILFILITNLALVNLVTGLIMEGVLEGAKTEDWSSELKVLEAEPFVQTVRSIIVSYDFDEDTVINSTEFTSLMADPLLQEVLECYGISLRIEPHDMFVMCDVQGLGHLSVTELASCLLRLRGSRDSLHPLLTRDDLHRGSRQTLRSLEACQAHISQQYEEAVLQLEQSLQDKIRDLQEKMPWISGGSPVKRVSASKKTSPGPVDDADLRGIELQLIPEDTDQPCSLPCQEGQSQPQPPEKREQGDATKVVELLHRASERVRLLENAVQSAEAELRASLDQEAALEAALACAGSIAAVEPEAVELEVFDAADLQD